MSSIEIPGETFAVTGTEFFKQDKVLFSAEMKADGTASGFIDLLALGSRGRKPAANPSDPLCRLATWTASRETPLPQQARAPVSNAENAAVTLGTGDDCGSFKEVSTPAVFSRGAKSVAFRMTFEPGAQPNVTIRGPWGTSGWHSRTCTDFAIVWGRPVPRAVTSIVSRADGKALPPGQYHLNAGGIVLRFRVR